MKGLTPMTALAPAEPTQAEEAPDAAESPLEGFRIGVTSDRRSRDLIEALERRGAEVLHAPALKIAPVQEDMRLIEDTRAIIAGPSVTLGQSPRNTLINRSLM